MDSATTSTADSDQQLHRTSLARGVSAARTCDHCRRRKVKCDRVQPCSRCRDQGLACTFSKTANLPRGRKGGRRKTNTELNARVAKLEDMVMQVMKMASSPTPGRSNQDFESPTKSPGLLSETQPETKRSKRTMNTTERRLASSVFTDLCQDIHDLAELLHETSDDNEEDNIDIDQASETSAPISAKSPSTTFFPFTPHSTFTDEKTVDLVLTAAEMELLLQYFMQNVDPVVKVLHPTVLQKIMTQTMSGDTIATKSLNGLRALKASVFYVTVTSLSTVECSQHLGQERVSLLSRLQSMTESSLIKADFMVLEEIHTLQALVFYLYALRSNDASKRTWTLTSLAVRLGQALDLHREARQDETFPPYSTFDTELRRRLWWQITLLDRHASFDRASDPIITYGSYNTRMPVNIDDSNLDVDADLTLEDRYEYTDVTLSLVCHEVFDAERQLNFVPPRRSDGTPQDATDWWSARRQLVVECESRLRTERLRHCNHSIPVQHYTAMVGEIMIAYLWLIVYRPLQRHPSQPTPSQLPPHGILLLATRVIESMQQIESDPQVQNFSWLSSIWVQWHALAVMIADLHVHVNGPVVDRAWTLLDSQFDHMGERVADDRQGRLWKFMKKMLAKARQIRNRHLESVPRLDVVIPDSVKDQGSSMSMERRSHFQPLPDTVEPYSEFELADAVQQISFDGQAGATTGLTDSGQAYGDWIVDNTNETLNIDQEGWAEWEAFVNEYQSMSGFTY